MYYMFIVSQKSRSRPSDFGSGTRFQAQIASERPTKSLLKQRPYRLSGLRVTSVVSVTSTRQEVGVQALQDLRRQREAMIRMKDNTHDVGLEPQK